ncbi:putative F-box/LRR-repeat protein At5g02930 [Rhodamnia argentea]|uniref:F-box/LRR-repeat protein At5g02930 n=1 Tax=Rhodamnia argentea TaxID=178133 RepID=A0ABM3H4I7_9MYRT|nr:putative F-box/LRR-repeat protein At5g02930 [Rhodamnia argentea]
MPGTSKQTTGRKYDKDYISLLPDCLITHIFSFLPTRDVVKACVLSKSWRSVWTTISDLRFSVSSYDDDSFVDRVLTLYEWAKVKKFHLDIRAELIYPFQIDSWVRFANDHQVEELHLNHYIGHFSSSERISWSSLKSLSLQDVSLSDDVLQKILLGSPVLEYLNLKRCYGVKGIHSTSLKELVIVDNNGLRILTPQLLLLRVTGHSHYEAIRLVEAPPLLEAELDFYGPHESDFCLLKEMLCKLQNAT